MTLNEVNGVQFYTNDGYPLETLQRCQKRLLEMLAQIQSILEPEGIKVIASYGTMLGTVRHGGYIPWDDDLDVFILDEQYEQALELLRTKLGSDIVVQDRKTEPGYWCGWSKLRDTSSEVWCSLWPRDNTLQNRGICLDLHRLRRSTVGGHNRKVKRMKAKANARKAVARCKKCLSGKSNIFRKVVSIGAMLLRLCKQGVKYLFASANGGKEIFYYGAEGSVVERTYAESTVMPLKQVKFEGSTIWLFGDADKALSGDYGDYMQMPSLENRLPHYDWIKFN